MDNDVKEDFLWLICVTRICRVHRDKIFIEATIHIIETANNLLLNISGAFWNQGPHTLSELQIKPLIEVKDQKDCKSSSSDDRFHNDNDLLPISFCFWR